MNSLRTILFSALAVCIISCSSDDDEIKLFNSFSYVEEEYQTDTINGWAISRDESERVCYLSFFNAGQDPIDKLYSSPTSFDELKHLFPLSEGNEIRLTGEGETGVLADLSDLKQYYEDYTQYYKGVPVQALGRIYYYITPQGKRMSYAWTGPFIDIKNLDTNPNISEQEARQILAKYLKVKRDDSWSCSIYIIESPSRNNGTIVRKQRLVYHVWGPYAPSVPGVCYFRAPQYNAIIDAHTGELISVSD